MGSVISSSRGMICASDLARGAICGRSTTQVVASVVASIVSDKAKHSTGLTSVPYTKGANAAGSRGSK